MMHRVWLALEDGSVWSGESRGAVGTVRGEVVFNTAMSGYEEVLTDPSYAGQIVVMTAPMIGNTGINHRDAESGKVHLLGFVTAEMCDVPSHHRSRRSLPDYLLSQGTVAATGIDTRAITARLRTSGVQRGVLTTEDVGIQKLRDWARNVPPIESEDWVARVAGTLDGDSYPAAPNGLRVTLFDFGAKGSIVRQLEEAGVQVRLVPPHTSSQSVLEDPPDGVVLSNGPGDPARLTSVITEIRGLLGRIPMLGICLGHQLPFLPVDPAFPRANGTRVQERVCLFDQQAGFRVPDSR